MAVYNFKLHISQNKTQFLLCLVLPNKKIYRFGVKFEKNTFWSKTCKTKQKKKLNFVVVAEYGFLHVLKKVEKKMLLGKPLFCV